MARYKRESNFKKSYIPVILTSIMLVVLLCGLGYVIFFMKDNTALKDTLYVKSDGTYKVEAYVQNILEDEVYETVINQEEVESFDTKKIQIVNKVNNDFVDKDFMVGGSKIKLTEDNNLLIHSTLSSISAYVGLIDLNAKTKWILDLSNLKCDVIDAFYKDKKAYVFYKKNNNLYARIIDAKGKLGDEQLIQKTIDKDSIGFAMTSKRFVFFRIKEKEFDLYEIGFNLKKAKNLFEGTSDLTKDVFYGDVRHLETSVTKDDEVYFIMDNGSLFYFYVDSKNSKALFPILKNGLGTDEFIKVNGSNAYIYAKKGVNIYNMNDDDSTTIFYNNYLINEDDEEVEYDQLESPLFNISDLSFDGNKGIINLENDDYIGYDIYNKNKISKRIFINRTELKDNYSPKIEFMIKNDLYFVYVFGDNNISIDKYEIGD